jgi:two-component system, OmpR family, sensor kinase
MTPPHASEPSRPASGLRRWLAGRTLRGRLITGLVALLAVACAVVGVVTYLALRQSLVNQIDRQLTAAGGRYASCMEANDAIERAREAQQDGESGSGGPVPGQTTPGPVPGEQDCSATPGLAAGTFGARVKNGLVTAQGVVGGKSHPTAADKAALARLTPAHHFYTMELPWLGADYRLIAVPGHDGDVLITGLPLTDMESTLRKVELASIAVSAAVLLLTGIIGTAFVGLSLRPLRRVAATATRVTQLPLASGEVSLPERVPDADPRTEVGQVGAAFNRMLGHVESALTRRAASEARLRRFAADASHELRTPLAAIRGYAELARRHPGPVPADIAHALGRVESESARMSVLVDELLLLAQLDAGRPLASEAVDLTRLAIDAASDARAATPDHRWQLELPDEPVLVRGDEYRLRQVLTNLLGNAGRHTPAGTTVTVALAEPDPAAGTVVLSVTDNGPGIPAGLQPGLFERFVRGDASRSHATGGTGLGLAIVDAVTAAHGGNVGVTSRPGQTRFVITLPSLAGPAGPPAATPPPGSGPDARPLRSGAAGSGHGADLYLALLGMSVPAAGEPPGDMIEDHLDRLLVSLTGSPRQIRHTLAEVEAHLRDAVAEGIAAGLPEQTAQAQALGRIGPVPPAAGPPAIVVRPSAALARRLILTCALIGSAGLIAIGVAGLVGRLLLAARGNLFMTAPWPPGSYTQADCARWLAGDPGARSCVAAMLADHAGDFLLQATAAGLLGLIAGAGYLLLRSRWQDRAMLAALPVGTAQFLGAALAGLAALVFFGTVLDIETVQHGIGVGEPLSLGVAALLAALGFSLALVLCLRRARQQPGG